MLSKNQKPLTLANIRSEFEWNIPENYNIGFDVCDRWAEREPERLAIIHVDARGESHHYSYGALADGE